MSVISQYIKRFREAPPQDAESRANTRNKEDFWWMRKDDANEVLVSGPAPFLDNDGDFDQGVGLKESSKSPSKKSGRESRYSRDQDLDPDLLEIPTLPMGPVRNSYDESGSGDGGVGCGGSGMVVTQSMSAASLGTVGRLDRRADELLDKCNSLLRSYEGDEHLGWRPNWARTSVQSDVTFGSLGDDSINNPSESQSQSQSQSQYQRDNHGEIPLTISKGNKEKKDFDIQMKLEHPFVPPEMNNSARGGSLDLSLGQIDDLLRESTELSASLSAYRRSRYGREYSDRSVSDDGNDEDVNDNSVGEQSGDGAFTGTDRHGKQVGEDEEKEDDEEEEEEEEEEKEQSDIMLSSKNELEKFKIEEKYRKQKAKDQYSSSAAAMGVSMESGGFMFLSSDSEQMSALLSTSGYDMAESENAHQQQEQARASDDSFGLGTPAMESSALSFFPYSEPIKNMPQQQENSNVDADETSQIALPMNTRVDLSLVEPYLYDSVVLSLWTQLTSLKDKLKMEVS